MENKPKSTMNKSVVIFGIGLFIIGLLLFMMSVLEKGPSDFKLFLGFALMAIGILMAGWQVRKRMIEKTGGEKDRWR